APARSQAFRAVSPARRSRRARRSLPASARRGRARRRRRTVRSWLRSACSRLRWAFALLLEVAAACLLGLQPVSARFRGNRLVVGEVDEDRLLTDDWHLAGRDEDGDRLGAGAFAQQYAVVLLHRHLTGQVIDPELGQPLPDTP